MGVIVGVLSGGIVMYVSPVVDKAIKPLRSQSPISRIETNNLQVTFTNLSMGGDTGFGISATPVALVPATKHNRNRDAHVSESRTLHREIDDPQFPRR